MSLCCLLVSHLSGIVAKGCTCAIRLQGQNKRCGQSRIRVPSSSFRFPVPLHLPPPPYPPTADLIAAEAISREVVEDAHRKARTDLWTYKASLRKGCTQDALMERNARGILQDEHAARRRLEREGFALWQSVVQRFEFYKPRVYLAELQNELLREAVKELSDLERAARRKVHEEVCA